MFSPPLTRIPKSNNIVFKLINIWSTANQCSIFLIISTLDSHFTQWWWKQKQPPEVFCKGVQGVLGVLRNFAKFTGKHLCKSLFFLFWNFSEHLFYRTPPDVCFGEKFFRATKSPSIKLEIHLIKTVTFKKKH